MKKAVLLTAAFCSALGATAQVADSLYVQEENADFTFTETQLDEESDVSQTVSSVIGAQSDTYLSKVGYRWSSMRFRVRALDNRYSQYYMNGLLLNDQERGTFNYSQIGGMNDATRNRENVGGYEFNNFGLQDIGGGTNINSRASQFAEGSKLTLSATNRNYILRGAFTHATGVLPSGWAFAANVGYRWAKEGVIEGTFYSAFNYFLAAEKRLGDGTHSLSLVTFGAPTKRGTQTFATEEAYWLANSHYYNPNWGYQNGKKRNAAVVKSFEPTTILTWDWRINELQKLTTSAGFTYNSYGKSSLGWAGDAYDPRPTYYKNLPSSIFNVYDPERNNPDYLAENPYFLEQYETLVDYWTSSKANRQINWDKLYYVNRENEKAGGEALYYLYSRHSDQLVYNLSSTYNHTIDRYSKASAGLQMSHTKTMHYNQMEDLLGGTRYTDIDKFAASDYGLGSEEAQNDLRYWNRQVKEGDKFGNNYNIFVNKANFWAQYQYNRGSISAAVGGDVEGTSIEREGLMQNGRAPKNSYGKSGHARFLGGGGKFSLAWRPAANNRITFSGSYDAQAPLARNSFVAPEMQNNFVDNLHLERIFGTELAYSFRFGELTGKLSGYYAHFSKGVEQSWYYNDQQSTFTYLTMSNVSKAHYGLEAAFVYQVDSHLSFNLIGTISDAKYVNNPYAQISYQGMNASELERLNQCTDPNGKQTPLRVVADGMRVSGTPLTAVSLGANYNINGWFFEANLNYYDRVYVGWSQYRRLNATYRTDGRFYTPSSVDANGQMVFEPTKAELETNGGILFDNAGNILKAYAIKQEKFDGGFMLDLSIGRYLRLKKGKSLSINLSVNNVTNNRNMRTGGMEWQRADNYYNERGGVYSKGEAKAYQFSKNARYYYANAINAFLNIGFKF
ncbi:MAG: TonB-dependent receptor [Alloprevotella sp.]|nr:TonB-dependent receptor [Alloprevotella sp.]